VNAALASETSISFQLMCAKSQDLKKKLSSSGCQGLMRTLVQQMLQKSLLGPRLIFSWDWLTLLLQLLMRFSLTYKEEKVAQLGASV